MPITKSGLNYVITDIRPPWRTSGRPVVFHHGVGATLDIFADWVPVIAAHHPIVRFDLRGFGASAVPPQDHVFSMKGLVDDLFEVADAAFGAGPVHLVGESIGGAAVLAAAQSHAQRVLSVTASNTPVKGADIGYVRGWREEFARIGVAGWSKRLMKQRFVPGAVPDDALAYLERHQGRSPAHVVLGLGDVLAAGDFRQGLEAIRQPLLLLMPDQSPYVSLTQTAEIVARVPQAEVAVFPGARHGLPLSHGRQCAEILLGFLARTEKGIAPSRRDVSFD